MAKTITFRFQKGKESIRSEMDRVADERGITVSALIVEALEEKLGADIVKLELLIPKAELQAYEKKKSASSGQQESGADALVKDLAKVLKCDPSRLSVLHK